MKKIGAIIGGAIAVLSVIVLAFGAYIQYEETQTLKEIEDLSNSGNYIESFNLAQSLLDIKPVAQVQAQALYWQSFCLYKKGEYEQAETKIKRMISIDSGYDRMSEDEEYQKFYIDVRKQHE